MDLIENARSILASLFFLFTAAGWKAPTRRRGYAHLIFIALVIIIILLVLILLRI